MPSESSEPLFRLLVREDLLLEVVVIILHCPELHCGKLCPDNGADGSSPTSRSSRSIQIASTSESAFHFMPLTRPLCQDASPSRNSKLPCRKPFLSSIATSHRPFAPAPPPSYPYRTSPDRRFPLGRQSIWPSRPGKDSDVADKDGRVCADEVYILICRRESDESGCGSKEEMAKNAASPRNVMFGRPSSVGWEREEGVEEDATG